MSRAAKTVAKWKEYSRDVKKRITASRVRNSEIGEAGNLMEYLIAIVGPVTRTEDCEAAPRQADGSADVAVDHRLRAHHGGECRRRHAVRASHVRGVGTS